MQTESFLALSLIRRAQRHRGACPSPPSPLSPKRGEGETETMGELAWVNRRRSHGDDVGWSIRIG
jgi:hypothetical protein